MRPLDARLADMGVFRHRPKKTQKPHCERVEGWSPGWRKAERVIGYCYPFGLCGLMLGIAEVAMLVDGHVSSGFRGLPSVYMYRSSRLLRS